MQINAANGLQAAIAEIEFVLAEEGLVPAPQRAAVDSLPTDLAEREVHDLQERYFIPFDSSRTLSPRRGAELCNWHGQPRRRPACSIISDNVLEIMR